MTHMMWLEFKDKDDFIARLRHVSNIDFHTSSYKLLNI